MVAKKSKKKVKSLQPNIDITKIITYFLSALICAGIFFKGYFFEYQSLTVNIITGAFFTIIMVVYYRRKIPIYYDHKFFLLGGLFLFINIIGLFFASNVRDALGNVLLIFNALLIFLLAIQAFRQEKNLLFFLKVIYWSTIVIAVIGIISYVFGINILHSYEGNRLFTTISYPNTAALMLVMAFFIGLFIIEQGQNKIYIYYFNNALLFLAFLATKSRGVLLLFPVLIFLYIILLDSKDRLEGIKKVLYILIPCIILFPLLYNGKFGSRTSQEIIVSIVSLLILFAIYFLSARIKINKKVLILTCIFIVFTIAGTSIYFINKNPEVLANNDILNRLKKINFQERSVQERFIFMGDALKIVKDNLLLGVGGGGWNAEYKSYRSFLYFTTEVHNHYLQVMVENGLSGFIIYILIWMLLIYNIYKRLTENKSLLNITTFILVISIFLHSFIDFDLTYPLFYFLFWIFIAISVKQKQLKEINIRNRTTINIFSCILLLFVLVNSALWLGWTYGNQNITNVTSKDVPRLINSLEYSVMFDPFNSENLTKLAQLYYAKGNMDGNGQYVEKALTTMDKAIKYNPTIFSWYLIKTRMLIDSEQYEKGFQTALKAIELAPLEEFIYYDTARSFITAGGSKGVPYAEKIIKMAQEEGGKIKQNPYEKFWRGTKLYNSKKLAFIEGQIYFNNKNYSLAQAKFAQAQGVKELTEEVKQYLQKSYNLTGNYIANGEFETGELYWWKLHGKDGKKRKLTQVNDQWWMNISKDYNKTSWWGFYQLVYEFEPEQKYNISFDAFSKYKNGEIQLIIHQVGENGANPQKTTKILINEEIKSYNWLFQTDNLNNKHSLRVYFLVPNDIKAQDVYITNIKMTKVKQ
jgi:tetratricopeptide (TPR) repeat protein